jgi:hypothetical protein
MKARILKNDNKTIPRLKGMDLSPAHLASFDVSAGAHLVLIDLNRA